MNKTFRKASSGNALVEYVLPAGILLLTCGILLTTTDLGATVGEYFLAASGHNKDALSDGVFQTAALGSTAAGFSGNGSRGFSSFGRMLDATGQPTGESASGVFFIGPISRQGARIPSSSPEYLYP